jgi:hypothetical protein
MSVLLEDYNDIDNFSILESEIVGGERTFKLRGSLGRCDFPNKNKRVYPRSIMVPLIEELQTQIRENRFLGEINHPQSRPQIDLTLASHKITSFQLNEDGHMVGEIVPLSTTKGKELNALLKDGVRVGVSTRGTGTVKPYKGHLGEGLVEVQPGFRMFAIDIVSDPSAGTFPEMVVESAPEIIPGIPFKRVWALSFKNLK